MSFARGVEVLTPTSPPPPRGVYPFPASLNTEITQQQQQQHAPTPASQSVAAPSPALSTVALVLSALNTNATTEEKKE